MDIRKIKVFLIDVNPRSAISGSLRKTFASEVRASVLLRETAVGADRAVPSYGELISTILDFKPNIIFLNLSMDRLEGIGKFIQSVSKEPVDIPVIIITQDCGPEEMIALLELGVVDFITPPIRPLDVLPRVWRILEHARARRSVVERVKERLGFKQLIGESPAFLAEVKKIPIVAKCDSSVLIFGETGTGKELCARSIHYLSPRAGKPFVPLSCGALPVELLENELFGHTRGAFTSAATAEHGLIREADGGTLFLDDVDCLPPSAQVKMLRFLQEREYRQLGSPKANKADVRIIASTNLDLLGAVEKGKFRQDLYYRLNIIPLMLPPLRERREDILLLAGHFLTKHTGEISKKAGKLSPDALQKLMHYDWPGNVRELEHVIERAVVLSDKEVIPGADIVLPRSMKNDQVTKSFKEAKAVVIARFEKTYIQDLLSAYQGNITKAAQVARKNRRAFWELIRKNHIDVRAFKDAPW
jgi:DNA-binding NtrC family response regulator